MKLKRVAILSISLLIIMSTDTVAPLVGKMHASYPEVPAALIRQTITLPSLIMIFFGFLAGWMVKRISKKTVLAIGMILYSVGGIAAGWASSFSMHLVLRAILGAGTGLLIPISSSLIADFYLGEERAKMIGYSSAISHLGGVITPPLAVWIGFNNWRNAFWIFAIAPLIFLFSMLFIPESAHDVRPQQATTTRGKIPRKVIGLSLVSFLIVMVFFIIITDIPFLLETKSDISAFVLAFGLSTSTLGTTISGSIFSGVYKFTKKWIVPIGLLICAGGFFLVTFSTHEFLIMLGLLSTGFGLGFLVSLITLSAANAMGDQDSTSALALINSAFSIGIFLSPIFYSTLPMILKREQSIIYNFQIGSIFFLIAGLASIPFLFGLRKFKAVSAD